MDDSEIDSDRPEMPEGVLRGIEDISNGRTASVGEIEDVIKLNPFEDSLGLVVASGEWTVWYCADQTNEDLCGMYEIVGNDEVLFAGEVDLDVGENVHVRIARDAINALESDEIGGSVGVYGISVEPEHLGYFVNRFPEMEVFRK